MRINPDSWVLGPLIVYGAWDRPDKDVEALLGAVKDIGVPARITGDGVL